MAAGRTQALTKCQIDATCDSVLQPKLPTNGSFYISAFSTYDNENAYLVGINPSELRAALDEQRARPNIVLSQS